MKNGVHMALALTATPQGDQMENRLRQCTALVKELFPGESQAVYMGYVRDLLAIEATLISSSTVIVLANN